MCRWERTKKQPWRKIDNTNYDRPSRTSGRFWEAIVQFLSNTADVSWALVSLSGGQPASHPHTKQASQPGQDKSRGSSHYGGSQGVLKPLYAPQREAVRGNTAGWSASKQERAQLPHHLHQSACSRGSEQLTEGDGGYRAGRMRGDTKLFVWDLFLPEMCFFIEIKWSPALPIVLISGVVVCWGFCRSSTSL